MYGKLGALYRGAVSSAYATLGLPLIRQWRAMQLRRLRPLAEGRPRGTPVVRHYWHQFLESHRADIRGRCLEIGTTDTVRTYGRDAVTSADALDLTRHSDEVTVLADLARADEVPGGTYDCFINQFTMHLIYDVEAALYHSVRLLAPGGVLLMNFSCVDYCFPRGLDMGTGRRLFVFWGFTPIMVENMLRRASLDDADFQIIVRGNLFARVAYQMNMPSEELSRAELETDDPGHPVLVCVRVVKPAGWAGARPEYRDPWLPDVTPDRWSPDRGHYSGLGLTKPFDRHQ